MSDPTVDLETLRQSRIVRLEADLHELASRLTHLHWPSTEAEVTDCRKMTFRHRYYSYRVPQQIPLLGGYAVGFRYSVDGRLYDGVLDSRVQVEPGDHFALRYNPDQPNENNSVCSDNSPSSILTPVITAILAILFIVLLIIERFFTH